MVSRHVVWRVGTMEARRARRAVSWSSGVRTTTRTVARWFERERDRDQHDPRARAGWGARRSIFHRARAAPHQHDDGEQHTHMTTIGVDDGASVCSVRSVRSDRDWSLRRTKRNEEEKKKEPHSSSRESSRERASATDLAWSDMTESLSLSLYICFYEMKLCPYVNECSFRCAFCNERRLHVRS